MNKIQKLMESINTDARGGFKATFLEGDKVEVTKDGKLVEVIELEKGDDIENSLDEFFADCL